MAANPFSSDWLQGGAADRLKPPGTLSYVSGATDVPLRFLTLPQLLDKTVARHGCAHAAAIFDAEGVRLFVVRLQRQADTLAAGLLALGLRRGNRVGIWAPNRHEWLVTQCDRAGRPGARQHQPAYRRSELEYALNKVGCRALVMARRYRSRLPRHARRARPEIHFKGAGEVLARRAPRDSSKWVLLGDEPVPPRCLSYARFWRSPVRRSAAGSKR